MKKRLKAVALVLLLVIIDQIVKSLITAQTNINFTLIPGFLKLSYVENTGGAYGLGADSILVLIGIDLFIVIFLIKYLTKNFKTLNEKVTLSLLLILSGGISNLTDRLLRGYVVDYLDINELINFPVFNIADICIVVGAIIMIVTILISTVKEQENIKKG